MLCLLRCMSPNLAPNGHGVMSELSPLSREKRKSDFGAVRAAFDPKRKSPPPMEAPAGYLAALVVNQICGVPLTPAFSIVVLRSGDDAKAFALSAVLKSCVTVTSFELSTD